MMNDQLQASHVVCTSEFFLRLRAWSGRREAVRAVALVGSVARGDARPDSDVDVVLLVLDLACYLEHTNWVSDMDLVERVSTESYGKVTSLRVRYAGGPEVEFAIASNDWATAPVDSGTEEVARQGILVLLDRDGEVTALAATTARRNVSCESTATGTSAKWQQR